MSIFKRFIENKKAENYQLPSDTELQKMSDKELEKLFKSKPKHSTNQDWARVAKEIRYREKFKK